MRYKIIFTYIFLYISIIAFTQDNDVRSQDNSYDLLYYADRGNLAKVKELVEQSKVDVNFKDYEGVNSLMLASQAGNTSIVVYLLEQGAKVNEKSFDYNMAALHSAVKNDYLKTAEALIRYGADIDIVDYYNRTALHYAVAFNYDAISDMLLYYGANPNICDNDGYTPLMFAIENNNDSLVDLLLKNDSRLDVFTNYGSSILHLAAYSGNFNFVKNYSNIFNVNGNLNNENMSAVDMALAGGQTEIFKWFLDSGYEVRDSISSIYTPKTLAKINKDKEALKILKQKKINDNAYLYFRRISAGYNITFNGKDFFMSPSIGLHEDRYGISLELGYMFRGYERRILYQKSDNIYYQLRENRQAIYFGFAKDFKIHQKNEYEYISLYARLRSLIFWGKYDGFDMKVGNTLVISPGLGLSYNYSTWFKAYFETSYLDLNIYESSHIFYSIGFKFLINFRNRNTNEKYKYIINF